MKNTFFITAVVALLIVGVAAVLWILGVGSFAEIQSSTTKAIAILVVVAAVVIGIMALAGHNKHLPPPAAPKM